MITTLIVLANIIMKLQFQGQAYTFNKNKWLRHLIIHFIFLTRLLLFYFIKFN